MPDPSRPTPDRPVTVVGGGISGVACARVLAEAGIAVRILDRGRRIGGRMAVRHEEVAGVRRPVDIGASYFTVRDERFAAVADDWRDRGLARVWAQSFPVLSPDLPPGRQGSLPVPPSPDGGPVDRWAATQGLRSLVEDLATGIEITLAREVEEVGLDGGLLVDGDPAAAVVLAMPEPQAYDLLPEPVAEDLGLGRGLDWSPTIAVWAAWPDRWWHGPEGEFDGAFVDGSPVLSWIADDGRRRGDGAAVLVAHVTGSFAADRLDDPQSAIGPVLADVAALLSPGPGAVPEPAWVRAHRWALASPRHPHPAPFALTGTSAGYVGVCGDAWGPRARVEQAWISGHELGLALRDRLAG